MLSIHRGRKLLILRVSKSRKLFKAPKVFKFRKALTFRRFKCDGMGIFEKVDQFVFSANRCDKFDRSSFFSIFNAKCLASLMPMFLCKP